MTAQYYMFYEMIVSIIIELNKALWPEDQLRARAEAEAVATELRASRPEGPLLREVDAWLAAR